jgi:hypothetical protein
MRIKRAVVATVPANTYLDLHVSKDTGLHSRARLKITMPETDCNKYRKQAKACEEQAIKTISELDKETWLRFAADWLKLAEDAEKRNRE